MDLSINEALEIVKRKDEKRYKHVYGTYEKAKELAIRYQINEYKCLMGAILHDYAKNETIDTMKKIIKEYFDETILNYDPVIYHGIVGSYLIQKDLGIKDKDIIDAVKYHVTGHKYMSDITKIVYIADYTEKNRLQQGVEFCRYCSDISLDIGVLAVSENTVNYLKLKNNNNIHPYTQSTYESFLKKVGINVYESIKDNYKSL